MLWHGWMITSQSYLWVQLLRRVRAWTMLTWKTDDTSSLYDDTLHDNLGFTEILDFGLWAWHGEEDFSCVNKGLCIHVPIIFPLRCPFLFQVRIAIFHSPRVDSWKLKQSIDQSSCWKTFQLNDTEGLVRKMFSLHMPLLLWFEIWLNYS